MRSEKDHGEAPGRGAGQGCCDAQCFQTSRCGQASPDPLQVHHGTKAASPGLHSEYSRNTQAHALRCCIEDNLCSAVGPRTCLVSPEKLADNYLIDKELPGESAQLLLNLICDAEMEGNPEPDPSQLIDSILTKIDKWTIRSSYLKIRLLQMLSRERESEPETIKLVSEAVVTTLGKIITEVARGESKHSTLWLVPAFISKLPDAVKEHLIQWLGEWLGEGEWWINEFTYCSCVDWQQPLLTLMTNYLSNKLTLIIETLHTQVLYITAFCSPLFPHQIAPSHSLKKFVDEVRTVDDLSEEQGIPGVDCQVMTTAHFFYMVKGG
eukprot:sb/3466805/